MVDIMNLSIIIPAWNEEKVIGDTLSKYVNYFEGQYNYEIVVVMDGCTDSTLQIVKDYSRKNNKIKYLYFTKKLGKGGGIIEGFKVAEGDLISFTDADGATSPEELDRLIESIGDWDGSIGSRWMDGSIILKDESFGRRIASRGFNLLVKLLFDLNYNDTQCGAKVFRKHAIEDIAGEIGLTNFAFDVDLLYELTRKGYRLKEIPINWKHNDDSSVNLVRVVPIMFISLIGLRMKTTPLWPFIPKWWISKIYDQIKND